MLKQRLPTRAHSRGAYGHGLSSTMMVNPVSLRLLIMSCLESLSLEVIHPLRLTRSLVNHPQQDPGNPYTGDPSLLPLQTSAAKTTAT